MLNGAFMWRLGWGLAMLRFWVLRAAVNLPNPVLSHEVDC
jgi:hypothetical protein